MSEIGIIESIRNFMKTCPLLDEDGNIRIDYLSEEAVAYTIDPVPATRVVQSYLDGTTERQQLFNFSSREFYSKQVAENLANSKFYEDLETWFEECSESKKLPKMNENQKPTKIRALTSGYLFSTAQGLRSAKYNIQCVLEYTQYKE